MMPVQYLTRFLRPSLVNRLYTSLRPPAERTLSTAGGSHVKVSMDDKTGVATMRMNRKPVNSFNLEMLTELVITLEKLENEKTCRGLIVTSAFPKIFSAGLDIMEMYQPEEGRLREFWRAVQEFWLRFYSCRLPVIAAINGHSPAGGCLLATCADYRIMAEGKYTIGLNETLLGIVAPFWLKDAMVNTIGFAAASRSLCLGQLYNPNEALELGLVDQLAAEDQVLTAAQQEIARWMKIPAHARELSKASLRRDTIATMLAGRDEELQWMVQLISSDEGQKGITQYVESLKKRHK